jgi:hypothetical protein
METERNLEGDGERKKILCMDEEDVRIVFIICHELETGERNF